MTDHDTARQHGDETARMSDHDALLRDIHELCGLAQLAAKRDPEVLARTIARGARLRAYIAKQQAAPTPEVEAALEDALWRLQVNGVGFLRGMGRYAEADENAKQLRIVEQHLATLRAATLPDEGLLARYRALEAEHDAFALGITQRWTSQAKAKHERLHYEADQLIRAERGRADIATTEEGEQS